MVAYKGYGIIKFKKKFHYSQVKNSSHKKKPFGRKILRQIDKSLGKCKNIPNSIVWVQVSKQIILAHIIKSPVSWETLGTREGRSQYSFLNSRKRNIFLQLEIA